MTLRITGLCMEERRPTGVAKLFVPHMILTYFSLAILAMGSSSERRLLYFSCSSLSACSVSSIRRSLFSMDSMILDKSSWVACRALMSSSFAIKISCQFLQALPRGNVLRTWGNVMVCVDVHILFDLRVINGSEYCQSMPHALHSHLFQLVVV